MEISEEQANEFRRMFSQELQLFSTFTHCEGPSVLTNYWAHIETTYSMGSLLFKITSFKKEKMDNLKYKYEILFNSEVRDEKH